MNFTSDGRLRVRYILITVILATLPCYCVGLVLVGTAGTRENQITHTPSTSPTRVTTISLTVPPTRTLNPTVSKTLQTYTLTPTGTVTPTSSPTVTFTGTSTSTATPTLTETPIPPSDTPTPSETLMPIDTATPTIETPTETAISTTPGGGS